ncbi:MAG: plasmid mobilization relaxosome protein MobC [Oscillospiraceae bacterium]|nr:plasmid mobilization relaxosome protein MobC [Oscillospiraceae bacterium]
MRHNVKKLTLRLTAPEYAKLRELSKTSGMKMEPLLRQLVMGENLRPRPPDTYAALLRELSAIGNNVNQLAHQANARGAATQEEIHAASQQVAQAWRLVRETL